jgi:predicted membrane channel-forming protein YqfA (hemolysin III family)
MKHGDKIELHCKSCNKTDKYSIDDLKAKESKIAILIGLLILIIGTPITLILLWDYIWQSGLYSAFGLILIIGIPGYVYMIINKNDQNRVRIFNRS